MNQQHVQPGNIKNRFKRAVWRRIARYGFPIFSPWENRLINRYSSTEPVDQPVFIIGAPRTGSTILYQLLTHYFHVLYIDNLTALFFRNLYLGFRLSHTLFKDKSHGCFRSFQGTTEDCGLHAPSECGDFWYRWLPREKHFISRDEIPANKRKEIGSTITAIINRWQKPLLIKNLNAGQRLGMIKQIFPGARFIFIKREPIYTAQSIWQARQQAGLQPHQWWSIMPENYEELKNLTPYKQIAAQIFYLEKQIMKDCRLFPSNQCIILNYDDLCRNPQTFLDSMKSFIGTSVRQQPTNVSFPGLRYRESQKIPDNHFSALQKELSIYNWEHYDLQ